MGVETKLPAYRRTLDDVVLRHNLTETQTVVYAAIFYAAEMGLPCPTGFELTDLTGTCEASVRFTTQRLINMGLLRRFDLAQRFRRMEIVATGKCTARHPSQHTDREHVARGNRVAGTAMMLEGGTYRIDTRKR